MWWMPNSSCVLNFSRHPEGLLLQCTPELHLSVTPPLNTLIRNTHQGNQTKQSKALFLLTIVGVVGGHDRISGEGPFGTAVVVSHGKPAVHIELGVACVIQDQNKCAAICETKETISTKACNSIHKKQTWDRYHMLPWHYNSPQLEDTTTTSSEVVVI